MLLEAQFGPDITPIETPRLDTAKSSTGKSEADATKIKQETSSSSDEATASEDKAHAHAVAAELARLHAAGLYVPGVEIRADRYVARVWLETLEVECASGVFGQRVKAVVERAAEVVAPLWSAGGGGTGRA
jgi:cleavage and polyadenylation specificity factor subunit 3